MEKILASDVDWSHYQATKASICGLFSGRQTDRPAVMYHSCQVAPTAPSHLEGFERDAWLFVEGLKQRVIVPGDSYVPVMHTGAGTCVLATAFGSRELLKSGLSWPEPCISSPLDIDHLKMPEMTAGKAGWVLEQTRAYREYLDDRIAVGIMDFQSPFTTVEQMLGSEQFFLLPYDDPKRFHALMDIVTDGAIRLIQEQIRIIGDNCSRGLWPMIYFPKEAGIQMADDNLCNVSCEVYEEFVIPYNNRISEAFGGLFLHSCIIREGNLATIAKLRNLTGVNCDISSGVSIKTLLEWYGEKMVVVPHCYINDGAQFNDYSHFMHAMLEHWSPPKRLFVFPCSVMYLPREAKEIPFNAAQVSAAMRQFNCQI